VTLYKSAAVCQPDEGCSVGGKGVPLGWVGLGWDGLGGGTGDKAVKKLDLAI